MTGRNRLEITASVIMHATEDPKRILDAINQVFEIEPEEFTATRTTGHFSNTITVYNARISGRRAKQFAKRFSGLIPDKDLDALVGQIEERTVDSTMYMRADKQVLIRDGRLCIINTYDTQGDDNAKDAIKLTIHTPIYNKKETVPTFEKILRSGSGID